MTALFTKRTSKIDFSLVHTQEMFEYILSREQARVERGGGRLALVIFDIQNGSRQKTEALLRAMLSRKRVTDDVGWHGDGKIGLILPDTGASGARVVAEDIRVQASAPVPYAIYCFPKDTEEERRESQPLLKFPDVTDGLVNQKSLDLEPLLTPGLPPWKRVLDLGLASVSLLLLSPLFGLLSLYIKATSPGPVFFRQKRIGFGGRPFSLLKFRTMRMNADDKVHAKYLAQLVKSDSPMTKLDETNDPRLIPFARVIRATGLDELPQLLNVLRGEMSLVGPRPCIPYEAENFELWQRRRFNALPGITGLWQVSGKNQTTFSQMVRLDIRYGVQPSLSREVKIILETVPTVLQQVRNCLRGRLTRQTRSQSSPGRVLSLSEK